MECPRAALDAAESQELWQVLLRSVTQHEVQTKDKRTRDVLEIEWPAVLAYQLARLTGDTEELDTLMTLVRTINAG